MADGYSYPDALAARVIEAWPQHAAPLPSSLLTVLDTAYHASFLREEERPVSCRIVCAAPEALATEAPPPAGLITLAFEAPRRFDEHELRRLSPAAKYHRALVGIAEVAGELHTWGFVQSGPRWMHGSTGGRSEGARLPPVLVVRIVRPGHVGVSCGYVPVAELRGGKLLDFTLDCFASKWLPDRFSAERGEVAEEHAAGGGSIAAPDVVDLTKYVAQQMLKRVIAVMRGAHHGGTLVFLPARVAPKEYLQPKYAFRDVTPTRIFRSLVLAMLAELDRRGEGPVNADSYRAAPGRTLVDLDEGLFELSNLLASLADVDGAVLLTRRFELLGFGAEIVGDLPAVTEVRRALDVEGKDFVWEATDAVGTRHRSAYRLCAAVKDALAIVVSQDGSVRFVAYHGDAVTYWEHGVGDD